MRITDNPERDMQEYEDELEEHMALFPTCEICGDSLMNEDCCIRIQGKWYCGGCVEIMSNDEMRDELEID